jgi:hypothetical protein
MKGIQASVPGESRFTVRSRFILLEAVMRRAALIAGTAFAVLAVSSPSYAFAHNAVKNPWLHAVLDVLTLAVVSAPLWTAYVWGGGRPAHVRPERDVRIHRLRTPPGAGRSRHSGRRR